MLPFTHQITLILIVPGEVQVDFANFHIKFQEIFFFINTYSCRNVLQIIFYFIDNK
jgi:hypothetical protein